MASAEEESPLRSLPCVRFQDGGTECEAQIMHSRGEEVRREREHCDGRNIDTFSSN